MSDVPLREYIEKLLEESDKRFGDFQRELDRRLHELNELRSAFSQQQGMFVARELYDERHAEIERKTEECRAASLPREVFNTTLAEWTKWRDDMNRWRNEQTGRQVGIALSGRTIVAVIGAVAALLTIVFTVLAANGVL